MPRVYLGDAFGLVWRTIVLTLCAKSKGIGSEKQLNLQTDTLVPLF
jgi:hypothetical protein